MKRLTSLLLSYLLFPSSILLAIVFSASVRADFVADISLISDYRFNGVSNSSRAPALQGGLTYAHESGAYVGGWASNVDFGSGDPSQLEVDFFAGYFTELNDDFGLDLGVSYFSYWGDKGADEGNYAEFYAGLLIQNDTAVYLYYAPDYVGADTGHYIVNASHEITLGDYALGFTVGHNQAQDKDKYQWGANKSSYQFAEVSVAREWQGFDVSAALIATTIDDGDYESNAKPTLLVGISRAFSW